MYPNGLRVLRDISPELLQAVRDAGYPYRTRRWERHDGTCIMNAEEDLLSDTNNGGGNDDNGDDDDDSVLEPLGIRRSNLQKVLYNYARFQGITVNFQKPLASAVERPEDGLVEITFGDGTKRLTRVLFGADGALGKSRSIVTATDDDDDGDNINDGVSGRQQQQQQQSTLKYTGVTCLMGLARTSCDGIYFPSSSETDNFHAVFFPTGPNESCFQFHIPVPEEEADSLNWGNLSQQVGREECQKMAQQLRARGWHPKYIQPLENVIHAVRVGFALLEPPLTKWVKGKIALVGDAAHPPVPYIGQGAQQGLEDAGVVASLLKIYCLDKHGNFDTANFVKAMTLYQDIRIRRSAQILDFSKSLGFMQSTRAHKDSKALLADNVLKGEVLMYGTLPIMLPGAGHDYKDDVKQATENMELPEVSREAAIEALEQLLGFVPPQRPNPQSGGGSSPVLKKKKMEFLLPESFSLPEQRIQNLIEWLVEGLKVHLKRIVAYNKASHYNGTAVDENSVRKSWTAKGKPILEELSETLDIPEHTRDEILAAHDPNWVMLPNNVIQQLTEYIAAVADLYHDNPFHNFEHACNVTVAVSKFLTRMTAEYGATQTLDDRTYGM